MEQFVYDKIKNSPIHDIVGDNVFPLVVPRSITVDKVITFTTIVTTDEYPNVKSAQVQFNIFAKKHSDVTAIAQGLYALFNQKENDTTPDVDIGIVFSIRRSESDVDFDYDAKLYQRQASYYFKIR